MLGARMMIEEGDDVAEVAAAVAAERGTTYVLIGQPPLRAGLARLRESLPERLIRRMPGVDVRIVADRAKLPEAERMSRILFPFMGSALSERTLDATLRLARSQDAVLMPAYRDRGPADALARGSAGGGVRRGAGAARG